MKVVNWKRVNYLFQGHVYTSLRTCFDLFLKSEKNLKFYIMSFICGTTCHVISIEVTKKLILDTDSDVGRQKAFHYDNMDDVGTIMEKLFCVDMDTDIVSNVYVRMK